jgi:ribosomal protein S18 acetylase RimI-like enzyme
VPELIVREISLAETRPLRHGVLRPHEPVESLASHEPSDAFAVGVFDREVLIAVGFVAPDGEPGAWRVRGMATVAAARGKGAGTAVLDSLLEHATARGASRVWCNARTPARSLYERAGFRVISEEFELPDIGPHFVMERRRRSLVTSSAQTRTRTIERPDRSRSSTSRASALGRGGHGRPWLAAV